MPDVLYILRFLSPRSGIWMTASCWCHQNGPSFLIKNELIFGSKNEFTGSGFQPTASAPVSAFLKNHVFGQKVGPKTDSLLRPKSRPLLAPAQEFEWRRHADATWSEKVFKVCPETTFHKQKWSLQTLWASSETSGNSRSLERFSKCLQRPLHTYSNDIFFLDAFATDSACKYQYIGNKLYFYF